MDRRRAAGALLALAACFASSAAAPTVSNQTSLDLYDAAAEGCYYNFQHYGEGDRIMTNEPCLNCTCHNRMLMCYLRVCPFTKPIGQDCTVEKRADQCCPIVTCPDVPVDLLLSTTSSPAEYGATGVGKLDKYGCSINGKYFPEGSKVPPTPNKPCEHCYCIRNMTTCVMQECTLHVDGCTPIYHKDVCCPVRYSCDHPEDEIPLLDDMSTTVRPTPGFLLTTTTLPPVTQITQDCIHNDQIFADGTSIKTEKPCEHCYCMKGDIVCVVQECGRPMENEGKNCTSQPPREGQCCPDTYICEGDELTTEILTEFTTHAIIEELTTLSPPRRSGEEGSGYRNEPDELVTTEKPFHELVQEPEVEGSGDEYVTEHALGSSEKPTPSLIDETFEKTEDMLGFDTTRTPISVAEEKTTGYPISAVEKETTEPDSELNTVPSGLLESSESSAPKLTTLGVETLTSEEKEHTKYTEYTTISSSDTSKEASESIIPTTDASFRKEDKPQEPDVISTPKSLEEYSTLEPTKEHIDEEADMTTLAAPGFSETQPETEPELPTVTETSQAAKEPTILVEHTISDSYTTTSAPVKVETTTINALENEIEEISTTQGPGRIPGEGDCLQNGITYKNESTVPSTNICEMDCKCISSIIRCDPIICSPPPEYMNNCVPTYDSAESCCPTYICDGSKETLPPQPHSQMSETEISTPTPSLECSGDECDTQEEKKTPIEPTTICTSGECVDKPSIVSETSDCGPQGCEVFIQTPSDSNVQPGCESGKCEDGIQKTQQESSTIPSVFDKDCLGIDCKVPSVGDATVQSCHGENCQVQPIKPCENEEECKEIPIPTVDTSCEGDLCKTVPIDCSSTDCDSIQETKKPETAQEVCEGENCKTDDGLSEPCADEGCRRKETHKTESKLPSECTDAGCKEQTPELLEPTTPKEHLAETPVYITESLPVETTLADILASREPSTQTEPSDLSQREKDDQGTTQKQSIEISTDTLTMSESTTYIPELTVKETSSSDTEVTEKPDFVTQSEIKTDLPEIIQKETKLEDKATTAVEVELTTIPAELELTTRAELEPETHTLKERPEIIEVVTEASIPLVSPEQESQQSTTVENLTQKIPEHSVTEQHSTEMPEQEHFTKQEEIESTEAIDQKEPTQDSTEFPEILEQETEITKTPETHTKRPLSATEPTETAEKETSTTLGEKIIEDLTTSHPEISKEPEIKHTETYEKPAEVTSEYQTNTDSTLIDKTQTELVSVIDEKSSTELPLESTETESHVPEEKLSMAETAATQTETEITTQRVEVFKSDEMITTALPEVQKLSEDEVHETTISPIELTTIFESKEFESSTPEREKTETSDADAQAIEAQSITTPKVQGDDEAEFNKGASTPPTFLEPEVPDTESPTLVDLENIPYKTDAPSILDDSYKTQSTKQSFEVFTEQPEMDTEEPSVIKEDKPYVTEKQEPSTELPLETESPEFIPVYSTTAEQKPESKLPEDTKPVKETYPESIPESITSVVKELDMTTLEPVTKVADFTETQAITKSPEFTIEEDEVTKSPLTLETKQPSSQEPITGTPVSVTPALTSEEKTITPEILPTESQSSTAKSEYELEVMEQERPTEPSLSISEEKETESPTYLQSTGTSQIDETDKVSSEVQSTEQEVIHPSTEAPESHVKETEVKETDIPHLYTTEKQAFETQPIDDGRLQTEEPINVSEPSESTVSKDEIKTEKPEAVISETSESTIGKEEESKTEQPEAVIEHKLDEAPELTSESTYSETTPDMIELVEHITSQEPEITTKLETTTLSLETQKPQEVSDLEAQLTTPESDKPIIAMEPEIKVPEEIITSSPVHEFTPDATYTTMRSDTTKSDTILPQEESQPETTEIKADMTPESDVITPKVTFSEEEPTTTKSDILDTRREDTPEKEYTTQSPESIEEKDIITEKPKADEKLKPEMEVIDKLDVPVVENEISSGEEPSTEKAETTESKQEGTALEDSVTKKPDTDDIKKEKIPFSEISKEPDVATTEFILQPESGFVTEQPEAFTTGHKQVEGQEPVDEQPDIPHGELSGPQEDLVTEKLELTEHSTILTPEFATEEPEIVHESKPDSSTERSDIPEMVTKHELTPSDEYVTTMPETPEIAPELKPESDLSTGAPEVAHKTKPEDMATEMPEPKPEDVSKTQKPEIVPEFETEVKQESPTDIPDISVTEKELIQEQEPDTIKPIIPADKYDVSQEEASITEKPDTSAEPESTSVTMDEKPSDVTGVEPELKPFTKEPETPATEKDESSKDTTKRPDIEITSEKQTIIQETESPTHIPSTTSEGSELPDTKEKASTEKTLVTEPEVLLSQEPVTKEPESPEIEEKIKPDEELPTKQTMIPEIVEQDKDKTPSEPSEDMTTTLKSEVPPEEAGSTTELPSYGGIPEKSTESVEIYKEDEDNGTLLTTARYPVKEEPSSITETEKMPTESIPVETEIRTEKPTEIGTEKPTEIGTEKPIEIETEKPTEIKTEKPTEIEIEKPTEIETGKPAEIETEKPTEIQTDKPVEVEHSKDTTTPEEEFLSVTSKGTTPKIEEAETSTQPALYDKSTKPQETTSEIPPSSIPPEVSKPDFNEVQPTEEVLPPDEESHFSPSAPGGYGQESDYEDENQPFGPGTCRYGGKVYVSAQQIPRDDPCDFCFCFRSDIICLQQSCPPPIHGCHEEPIQGFCCPRYECPVSMASTLNVTTTTTTTTTTLPPHFLPHAYQGAVQRRGCQIKGHTYKVGEVVRASSGPCLHCTCGGDGQMKCDPKACTPEPMLRQMIAAAVSAKRRR